MIQNWIMILIWVMRQFHWCGDGGKGDCILSSIKEMLGSTCPDDIRKFCLKVMELDLGRLEKGSMHFDTKQKSLTDHWVLASRNLLS